jgi:hypothetical protein
LVIARGGQPRPVGAEGQTDDVAAVAGEGEQLLTTRAVPHPDRLIPTARSQPCPVGAEDDTAAGGAVDGEDRPAAVRSQTLPSTLEASRRPSGLNATRWQNPDGTWPLKGWFASGSQENAGYSTAFATLALGVPESRLSITNRTPPNLPRILSP